MQVRQSVRTDSWAGVEEAGSVAAGKEYSAASSGWLSSHSIARPGYLALKFNQSFEHIPAALTGLL